MRVLVTGGRGMLAQALVPVLRGEGHEVLALDRSELDVTDAAAVRARLGDARPEVVVQCAAYTAVDRAETEPDVAHRVNALGTLHVARECQRLGSLLVYPSTDYVFRGDASRAYTPEDATDPVNVYGRSKREGEEAAAEAGRALVVRTSWLYGAGGVNFVDRIAALAKERESLDVVDDQIGRPTWTVSLSETIGLLLKSEAVGTFHASDGGEPVSWFGFAKEIVSRLALPTLVRPVPSSAFPRPAPRPAFSVLDGRATEAVIGRPLVDWRESLARYLRGER